MSKAGMMWHLAGTGLFELADPQGERPAIEVIKDIQLKTALPINVVLDLMRVSTSPVH